MGGVFIFFGYLSNFFAKTQLSPDSAAYRNIAGLHGTMIVFFGIVPVLFAGLGYFQLLLSDDFETWWNPPSWAGLALYYLSGVFVLVALFRPESPFFILAMLSNLAFAIICSGIFILAIIRSGLHGAGWLQMRSVVWTLLVTALILLPDFLFLELAAVKQLQGFMVSAPPYPLPSVGISEMPVFWYHLFWFMGHPEVFVILLPLLGLTMDVVRALWRKINATG